MSYALPEPDAACEDALERLVAEAVQEFEAGGEEAVARCLAGHPRYAEAVLRQLDVLRQSGLLAIPAGEPTRYGDFRVVRRLATGGMGVVYLAEHVHLQRRVALKVVRPEFLLSEVARERFQREVEAVARLEHPGIVPIFAVGVAGAVPWFAMEFVDGIALDALIRQLAASPGQMTGSSLRRAIPGEHGNGSSSGGAFEGSYADACVRVVRQIADAMSYVHERGIVHRDLKPSNVMLTRHGRALVVDFGLAHVQDLHRLTQVNARLGSPAYMAPEQVRGEALDERVDVYGLGLVLHELLATEAPFAASSPAELQQAIVAGRRQPLAVRGRGIGRELRTVVAVATDRDRARRYPSMQAFAEDLDHVLLREPIRARPLPRLLRVWRRAQRNPVQAVVVAATLFLLLQFPLVLWWYEANTSEALRAANDRLEQAVQEEARSSAKARASYEDAYVAIHEMLGRTGRIELTATPGSEHLRIELLERALGLYERLMERWPDDWRLDYDAARVLQKLGVLHMQIGDTDRAMGCYQRLFESIRDQEGVWFDGLRGVTHKLCGQLLSMRRDHAGAEAALGLAACELAGVVASGGGDDFQVQLAEVWNSLGVAAHAAGKRSEWRTWMERAFVLKESLLNLSPRDPDVVLAFGLGCTNLARCRSHFGERDAALQLLERGIAAMLQLSPAGPEGPEYRSRLADLYDQRGVIHNESERQLLAQADYELALGMLMGLCEEFPATARYSRHCGQTLHNLAMTWIARKDHVAALANDEQSIAMQRRAIELGDSDAGAARNLEYALVTRCVSLMSLRRLSELDAATAELIAGAVTGEGLLNAARLRIRHGQLAEGERERLHAEAAALVARAVEQGFRDGEHFGDRRFAKLYAELRGRPAFDRAVASLTPPSAR